MIPHTVSAVLWLSVHALGIVAAVAYLTYESWRSRK